MVVLLMLLLLSNLWFSWAGNFSSPPQEFVKYLEMLQNTQQKKEETCVKVKSAIGSLAASKNWEVKADQYGMMAVKLPNGETYVIDKDCKVTVPVLVGRLSPPDPQATANLAQGVITTQSFKFQVDVSLVRVLFQMLMYAAGIFWAVRVVQKLIAGDLTEMLISLFIGFIIVASMYVLYTWIPA
jgi:phage shock protein PspC (stress-responsive transcriptional regulator)